MSIHLKRLSSLQHFFTTKIDVWPKVIKEFHHNVEGKTSVVSSLDMKRALESANYPVLEGHACISTNLALCAADHTKKKNCKLHINKMTGT